MESYIPIFPLNTVLFPGILLEIQIFEERYKKMIEYTIRNDQPLGIFCIKEGLEAYGPLPEPFEVGTLAKIFEHDPLENIKHNEYIFRIQVLGVKKIKLLYFYESTDHYWIGNIISLEENKNYFSLTDAQKKEFIYEFKKYVHYLAIEDVNIVNLDNSLILCHLAIKYLNIPLSEKQKLLELYSFKERWEKVFSILKEKNLIIEELKKKQNSIKDDYKNN